eukprot:1183931-Prorocentrum_minimum.AAC.4
MELAANSSTYYMFMEDDFHVCPHFLRAAHYVIEKANHVKPNWLGIRVREEGVERGSRGGREGV